MSSNRGNPWINGNRFGSRENHTKQRYEPRRIQYSQSDERRDAEIAQNEEQAQTLNIELKLQDKLKEKKKRQKKIAELEKKLAEWEEEKQITAPFNLYASPPRYDKACKQVSKLTKQLNELKKLEGE